jgi:hypothetical protein
VENREREVKVNALRGQLGKGRSRLDARIRKRPPSRPLRCRTASFMNENETIMLEISCPRKSLEVEAGTEFPLVVPSTSLRHPRPARCRNDT